MTHIEEILTTFLEKMKNKNVKKYQDAIAKATHELLSNERESGNIIESIISVSITNIAMLSKCIEEGRFRELVNQLPDDIFEHIDEVNKFIDKVDSAKIN